MTYDVIVRRGNDSITEPCVAPDDVLMVVRTFAPTAKPVRAIEHGHFAWQMEREFGADTYSDGEYLIHAIPVMELGESE